VGRQPDVRTGGEDAFKMAPPLQEWDLEEGLAVDLEEVEGREDLATAELPRVRVSLLIDLEVALVLPPIDQNAIKDRGAALCLRDDRVVQLTRSSHFAFVADEVRLGMTDPDEDSRSCPCRLEDVALPRPGPRGRGGRHAHSPSVAPHLPREPLRLAVTAQHADRIGAPATTTCPRRRRPPPEGRRVGQQDS